MSTYFQFKVLALLTALTLWGEPLKAASCPLCERIERERALEQEKNGPQPIRYYDEDRYVGVADTPSANLNTSTTSAPNSSSNATPSINTSTDSSFGRSAQTGTTRDRADFSSSSFNSPTDTGTGQLQTNSNRGSFSQGRFDSISQTSSNYYDPYHDIYIRENRNEPPPGRSRFYENRFYLKENETFPTQPHDFIVRGEEISPDQAYSTIFIVLQTPNFLRTLNGPFTLFIPSNEALRKLSPATLQGLSRPENQGELAKIVGDHLVAQKLNPNELTSRSTIKTVTGIPLRIQSEGDITLVNGARIIRVERLGDNGIIYIVDNLLTP